MHMPSKSSEQMNNVTLLPCVYLTTTPHHSFPALMEHLLRYAPSTSGSSAALPISTPSCSNAVHLVALAKLLVVGMNCEDITTGRIWWARRFGVVLLAVSVVLVVVGLSLGKTRCMIMYGMCIRLVVVFFVIEIGIVELLPLSLQFHLSTFIAIGGIR
jgi:hypothetical protein